MAVIIYNGGYRNPDSTTRKQSGFLAGKTQLNVENDTTRANTEIRVGFVERIKGTSHTVQVAAWSVSDWEDSANVRDYRIEYDIEFTYNGNPYTISGNGTGTVNRNVLYCPDINIAINDSTRGKSFSLIVTKVACKLFQKKLFGSSYDRAGVVNFTGSGTASVTTATSVDLVYRVSSSSTSTVLKTVSGTPTKPLIQNYDTINSADGHYQYSNWTSVDTGQSTPKGTTIYPGDLIYSSDRVLLKYNLTLRYNSKITTNSEDQSMVLGEFTPQQKVTLPTENDLTLTLDSSHMILGVTDINHNGNWLPNGATKFALGSTVKLDVQTSDNDELFIHLVVIDKNIEYNVIPKLDSVSDSRYKFSVNFPYPDTYKQYTYFSNTHKVKYGELIKASIDDIFIDNAFKINTPYTLLAEYCPEITLQNNGEGSYAKDNIQLVASLVNTRGGGVKSYYCPAKYDPSSPYSTIVGLFTNSYDTSTHVIIASQTRDNCKLYCDGVELTTPIVEIEGSDYYSCCCLISQSNGVDTSPFKRRNIGTFEVLNNNQFAPMIAKTIGQVLLHQRGNRGEAIGFRNHSCFRDISVVPANTISMTNISNIKSEGTWKKGLLYKKIDGVWRQLLPFQKSDNQWNSLGRKFVVNYPSTRIKLVDPSDKYFRLNMYNHGKDVSSYWIQVSDTKQEPMPEDYFISRNQALSYVYSDSPIVVEENSDGSGLVVMNRNRQIVGISNLSIPTTSEDVLTQLKNTILSKLVVTIKDERQELPYQFLYENGEYYVPGVSNKSNFSSSVTDFFNESSKVQADVAINFGSPSQEEKVSIIYTVKLLSSDINFDSSEVSCEVLLKNPGSSIFTEDQTQVYASCISSSNFQGIVSHEVSQNSVTKRFDDIRLDSSPFHYDILNTHNSGFLTIVVVQTTDLTI